MDSSKDGLLINFYSMRIQREFQLVQHYLFPQALNEESHSQCKVLQNSQNQCG